MGFPYYQGIDIPADYNTGLPTPPVFQPEKAADVPIRVGERSKLVNASSLCYNFSSLHDVIISTMALYYPAFSDLGYHHSATQLLRGTMESTKDKSALYMRRYLTIKSRLLCFCKILTIYH